MQRRTTIYLDTSVINFLFATDSPQRRVETEYFFEQYIRTGVYQSLSDFVLEEINNTKQEEKRRNLLGVISHYSLESLEVSNTGEVERLAKIYIREGVIPAKKEADALHIAISVISQIDYLVSRNFQHLANANRELRVLSVNYANNYLHPIRIVTPLHLMPLED